MKKFFILTIDGGGIRGIFPAYILKRIKEELKIDFLSKFQIIAGTSTGSIIAGCIAAGIPIEKIYSLYEEKGNKIFKKRSLSLNGLLQSKYSSEILKDELKKLLGNKKLNEIKNILIIPCTDISNANVYLNKSFYDTNFVRDKNTFVWEAIISSCSAPVYFSPYKLKNKYLLADGGLWANNPSLLALTEALGPRLNIDKKDIYLLSIGTGTGKKYYDLNSQNWGLIKWGRRIIDTILNLQSINTHNICNFLLPKKNYLRLNFETDTPLSLDKLNKNLISKADELFTYKITEIKNFLKED